MPPREAIRRLTYPADAQAQRPARGPGIPNRLGKVKSRYCARQLPFSINTWYTQGRTGKGSQHSAADDAENSAVLLTLLHDKEAFAERTRITRELMNAASAPPPPAATLGDLFGDALSQWEFADDDETAEEAVTT